jgi:hypothetical protein
MLFIITVEYTPSIHIKILIIKQPQVGPSGGFPEEDIVIGDDNSMLAVAPEDLPLGQGVEDCGITDCDPVLAWLICMFMT